MAKEFDGYGRYFATEDCSVTVPPDPKQYIAELLDEEFDEGE